MPVTLDPEEILTRLFGSASRARILQFLLSHAGRAFYQREIMFETGLTLHPAQRELKNLYDLGIIKRRETVDKLNELRVEIEIIRRTTPEEGMPPHLAATKITGLP